MSSESFNKVIVNTSEKDLYITSTWTHFWAYLEAAADGVNSISYGSEYVEIDAGVTVNHMVAPGTTIRIRTTSTSPVRWAILITPVTAIDQIIGALCAGGKG